MRRGCRWQSACEAIPGVAVLPVVVCIASTGFAVAEQGTTTIKILTDDKKNKEFVKAEEESFNSFVYRTSNIGTSVGVRLSSKEFMAVWKGDARLGDNPNAGKTRFEVDMQFAPAFVVADIRNDTTRSRQITGARLEVAASSTDFQPFLTMSASEIGCSDGRYDPKLEIENYGWGKVLEPRLIYSFTDGSKRSSEVSGRMATFDQRTTGSVDGGLRALGVDVARLKAGKFKCASKKQVPACLAALEQSGIFGRMADAVYPGKIVESKDDFSDYEGGKVFSKASGRVEYDWMGSDGKTNHRVSPFELTIPLFHFDIVTGPECGAAGPVDRHEKPIELSLDRNNYRIPLAWRGQLPSRSNKRFALSLAAAKSSHHVMRLVLELADGNTLASPTVDLSYFKPRMPPPPAAEDSEEKK